ncbi:distal tail protein Dit, partial [Enterococcus sp. S52]
MISDLKITLDGFVLSDYFDLTEEPDRGLFPNVTNTTKQISRLNGVRVSQTRFEERYIKLSLYALNGNFREMKDRLALQLFKEGNQKLWFSDEPDRFFWVKLNGESSLKRSLEYRGEAYGTIEFICEDGLAHAIQTKDFQLVDDSVVIQNEGTYKAPITWTVDFLADCESIGFVTEDRILQLGYVTSEDIDEDLSNVVLFNDPMKSATSGQYSRNVGKI